MIWKTFFWQPIRLRQLQRKICVNISNLVTGNLYVYDNCNAERKIQFSVSCTLATYTSTPIATCQTIQLSDAMFLATYTSTPIATNTCYYYDTLNNTGNLYVYANCNCKNIQLYFQYCLPLSKCISLLVLTNLLNCGFYSTTALNLFSKKISYL